LQAQQNSSSCLTLLIASGVYWQAKEIHRVILEGNPEEARVDLSMLEHNSPVGWDNVLSYGEYVLDQDPVWTGKSVK
jgi:hypothetical protein